MSITPRVSEMYRYSTALDRINTTKAASEEINETAASGRRLRHISDDPVSTVKVLRDRNKIINLDQFKKTIDFGKGFLAKSEDALSSIHEALVRAKELCIQQSNSTYDDSNRKSVSSEIRQLSDSVVQLGNSTYNDKYVFAGFQTGQPPISSDGSYLGDDGHIYIQVDEDSFRNINVDGREVFEVPLGEEGKRIPIVKILNNVYYALESNNTDSLHKSMEQLDNAMNSIVTVLTSIGARRNALDDVTDRLDRSEVQLQTDLNDLESADMIKSAVDLKRAESALQFTLQASSKMLAPSLLEFIK